MSGNPHARSRIVAGALVALVAQVSIVACTGSGDSGNSSAKSDEKSATSADTPCAAIGDEKPSKALLRCGEHSVVFVETLYATGTGVAVTYEDQDYVLTNLHVVDPFDSADVYLGGTEGLGRLPVAGADVAADIALLGPIEDAGDAVEPVPLEDPQPEKGDDVFLVGFPGTADVDEADLTITSGLVSRTRTSDEWNQTYIQSDAVIGEGQSGGPLFAATGELLGISGLGLDPAFALALTIQDVSAAVERILGDDADEILQVPQGADEEGAAGPGATEGTISLGDDIESPTLFLPPSDEDRTWNLFVNGPDGGYVVGVYDSVEGEPLAINAAGVALTEQIIARAAQETGATPQELGGELPEVAAEVAAREIAPGRFAIEIDAGVSAEIVLSIAPDAAPAELLWTSDLPLWPLTKVLDVATLTIGEPSEGIVGGYQAGVPFQVELTAGQEVEFSASSPQGDVALLVAPPDRPLNSFDVSFGVPDPAIDAFEDSGEGLYGLDVLEPFTADVAGTYQVWLQNYDFTPLAYRIEVREP